MIFGVYPIEGLDELVRELIQNLLPIRSNEERFFLSIPRIGYCDEALRLETTEKGVNRAGSEWSGAVQGEILNQAIPMFFFPGEVPQYLKFEHTHLRYIDRHTI